MIKIKAPLAFINDSLESGCDVGEYERGHLLANAEQLAELKSRARHYAEGGTDQSPPGLVAAAKALLKAIEKSGF